MDHAELNALGAQFRRRRDLSRVNREKVERNRGLTTLAIGLLGGLVAVAVMIFAMT